MTAKTNQQGAPEALRPIQRYKIGYHTDEWGMRSSTPSGIPDRAGAWVRYEDHVAALVDAQQPAPSAAVALSDDLRDRLVAISGAIADQDDRAAQAMLREILAAPQPSPTPQADSAQEAPNAMQSLTAALKADPEYAWAWHCNLAMPIMDNAKVSHRVANITAARLMQHLFGIDTEKHPHFEVADEAPQADSQPAPVRDESAARDECKRRWLAEDEDCNLLEAYDRGWKDRAARAPADSVTAPAAYSGNLEQELAMLIRRIVSSARRNCEDGSNVLKLANEAWAYLVRKGLNGSPLRDAGIETAPTPPAQAADSVLEDAARLKEAVGLLEELSEHDNYSTEYDGRMLYICTECGEQDGEHRPSCAFVRAKAFLAARKQGGKP